jgi:adenosylhomocysteine nucleosidase
MTEPAAEDDLARCDLGIVCALPLELGEFLSRCERVRTYTGGDFVFRGGRYDGIRIVVVESGAGQERARRAAQALVDAHRPKWILSCGFAGAMDAKLKTGEIIVADKILAPAQPTIQLDFRMPADPNGGWHVGGLLTMPHIVRTVDEKRSLAAGHDALAIDMETYGVAAFCREQHHRFFAVRVCTDDLSADLPAEVLSLFGTTGAVRWGAVVGALWNRPGSYQDMLKLREQATQAATRLADFLDGIVKQLHAAV